MKPKLLRMGLALWLSGLLILVVLALGLSPQKGVAKTISLNSPPLTAPPYQALTDTHSVYLPLVEKHIVIRFAVLGDYGWEGEPAEDVANLVKSWNPDFMVTVGDNNYVDGSAGTIDPHIGQYYHSYIHPYVGSYGPGADENRFFPALGNHDWNSLYCSSSTACIGPHFDYFSLPGNERYYDFERGAVHFFILDSDGREPDGRSETSTQGQWLQSGLENSTAPWKLVFLHHAPYSSGNHGPQPILQWPYISWGADAVIAGHDHIYERLMLGETPFFVNGLGGRSRYDIEDILPESVIRYDDDFGAMLVTADYRQLNFQFITRSGQLIDDFSLSKAITVTGTSISAPEPLPLLTATPQPPRRFKPYHNLKNIPQHPFISARQQ